MGVENQTIQPIRLNDPDWLEKVEYGRFVLSRFAIDSAALCKYLIRARRKVEPGFLPYDEFKRWKLDDVGNDREPVLVLLKKAATLTDMIDAHMVAMGGSGGCSPDDPLADFKFAVAGFAFRAILDSAVVTVQKNKPVPWNTIAKWDSLNQIRKDLDHLLDPNETTEPFKRVPIAESKRVKLFPAGHHPQALIGTDQIVFMTPAQQDVITALLEAGEGGLSGPELIKKSGRGDARGVLKRLASNEKWKCVLQSAGRQGGRYRIF